MYKIFKKGFSLSVIIIFLGLNFSSVSTITVKSDILSNDGNTLYVGGNGPGNYSQIQDAIDEAYSGDTVFVYNGIYDADIIIDTSISLIGENQEATIIKGGNNGITIEEDGVIIKKFTIENCGGFWHRYGIRMISNNNKISNVTISNNGVLNGIYIEHSSNNIIENNIISNNLYFGIRLAFSTDNIIKKNIVTNVVTDGIMLSDSSNNEIFLNTVEKCTWGGISSDSFCEDNKIYHNTFIENDYNNSYDEGGNIWDDGYPSGGNFWSDYTGEDTNSDGIGDTQYTIPGGSNQDRYPLMYPYAPKKPSLYCDLELIFNDVKPNEEVKGKFIVGNNGMSGSYLNWKVETYPEWGTWGFTPTKGYYLSSNTQVDVEVDVAAPEKKSTQYTGIIKIVNIHDPEDFCEIPVILTTTRNKELHRSIISNLHNSQPNILPIIQRLFKFLIEK